MNLYIIDSDSLNMNPQVDSFDSRGKRSIQGSKCSNSSPSPTTAPAIAAPETLLLLVVFFVDKPLVVVKGKVLVIGELSCDIWEVVVGGFCWEVINTEVVPETTSEESGAILATATLVCATPFFFANFAPRTTFWCAPRIV